MNWAAAGVISEIVGAIAVVVSLLFLASEVKRNRNATESTSVDALAEPFRSHVEMRLRTQDAKGAD